MSHSATEGDEAAVMGDNEGGGNPALRDRPDPNWVRLRELLASRPSPELLVFDPDGNLVGLERERPESPSSIALANLLASEEIVVVADGDRRIIAANEPAAQAARQSVEELIGRDLFEGIDSPLRDSLIGRFALGKTRPGATSQPVSAELHRPDGTSVWVVGQATNLLGDPEIRGVVVRAREVVVSRPPPPAEFAALPDEVVDLLPMGLVVVSDDLTIVRVNRSFAALIGREESELVGERLSSFIDADDLARYATYHGRAVHDSEPYHEELRLVLPDGHQLWALVSGSPATAGGQTVVINQVVDITDTKSLVDELSHMATTDDLTGLPNRAMLDDRANQALARQRRHGGIVAAIFIDLDWFKPVNDLHKWEHRAGDEALVALAQRIRDAIRPTDTAARYGGDEFLVVCTDFSTVDDVDMVVRRIFDALHVPVDIGGLRVVVGASIGVAIVPAGSPVDWDEVKAAADAAMFQAKEDGKGRIVTVVLPPAS